MRFTKHEQTGIVGDISATVVCGFGDDVGEVDTLVEHITGNRGFWRCNTETLGKDTGIVGGTRTMPEEFAVAVGEVVVALFIPAVDFIGTIDTENVFDFEGEVVSGSLGLLDVCAEELEFFGIMVERSGFVEAKAIELGIDGIDIGGLFSGGEDFGSNLHVRQVVDEIGLFLKDDRVVDEVRTVATKVVGNDGVVAVGEVF